MRFLKEFVSIVVEQHAVLNLQNRDIAEVGLDFVCFHLESEKCYGCEGTCRFELRAVSHLHFRPQHVICMYFNHSTTPSAGEKSTDR